MLCLLPQVCLTAVLAIYKPNVEDAMLLYPDVKWPLCLCDPKCLHQHVHVPLISTKYMWTVQKKNCVVPDNCDITVTSQNNPQYWLYLVKSFRKINKQKNKQKTKTWTDFLYIVKKSYGLIVWQKQKQNKFSSIIWFWFVFSEMGKGERRGFKYSR